MLLEDELNERDEGVVWISGVRCPVVLDQSHKREERGAEDLSEDARVNDGLQSMIHDFDVRFDSRVDCRLLFLFR